MDLPHSRAPTLASCTFFTSEFGEYSREVFDRWQKERIYPAIESASDGESADSVTIDNTDIRGGAGIRMLHALLGLAPPSDDVDTGAIAATNEARLATLADKDEGSVNNITNVGTAAEDGGSEGDGEG